MANYQSKIYKGTGDKLFYKPVETGGFSPISDPTHLQSLAQAGSVEVGTPYEPMAGSAENTGDTSNQISNVAAVAAERYKTALGTQYQEQPSAYAQRRTGEMTKQYEIPTLEQQYAQTVLKGATAPYDIQKTLETTKGYDVGAVRQRIADNRQALTEARRTGQPMGGAADQLMEDIGTLREMNRQMDTEIKRGTALYGAQTALAENKLTNATTRMNAALALDAAGYKEGRNEVISAYTDMLTSQNDYLKDKGYTQNPITGKIEKTMAREKQEADLAKTGTKPTITPTPEDTSDIDFYVNQIGSKNSTYIDENNKIIWSGVPQALRAGVLKKLKELQDAQNKQKTAKEKEQKSLPWWQQDWVGKLPGVK